MAGRPVGVASSPRPAHPCASRTAAARPAAVAGCAIAVALTGCGGSAWTSGAPAPKAPGAVAVARASSTYTLMQMNLCLSGLAGCYGKVAYPAGVKEAVARIRAARPDAVTLNEACRGDVDRIARMTGYHARFSTVIYRGRRLRCITPGGRGVFGDAVLTRAAIVRGES